MTSSDSKNVVGKGSEQTTYSDGDNIIEFNFYRQKNGPAVEGSSVADWIKEFEATPGHGDLLKKAREELAGDLEAGGQADLAVLRLRAGLSQAELAARLETGQPRISIIENGSQEPGIFFCRKMADELGVSLDEFERAARESFDVKVKKSSPRRSVK